MTITDEIDNHEFEEARRCLINSYDSYIQNHAGLLIAIIIGGLALSAEWRNFTINDYSISIFAGLLSSVGFGFLYIGSRMAYWTKYADVALSGSLTDFYHDWSKRKVTNKDDSEKKISYTAMIQYASIKYIFTMIKGDGENKFGFWDAILIRFAIWVSRTTNPDKADKSQSEYIINLRYKFSRAHLHFLIFLKDILTLKLKSSPKPQNQPETSPDAKPAYL